METTDAGRHVRCIAAAAAVAFFVASFVSPPDPFTQVVYTAALFVPAVVFVYAAGRRGVGTSVWPGLGR